MAFPVQVVLIDGAHYLKITNLKDMTVNMFGTRIFVIKKETLANNCLALGTSLVLEIILYHPKTIDL